MSIGKRLIELRKKKGISQQELADYLHISRQTISKFEHDLSLPNMDVIVQLSEYYQISINELLGIEDSKNEITDFYKEIQQVSEHIQKNNKKSKILNMVLIGVCIISLGLSGFMVSRIKEYDSMIQSIQDGSKESLMNHRRMVNIIDNQSQLFLSKDNETYMKTKYDLNKNLAILNYQFTLKEYTEKTTVKIEFIKVDEKKYSFELKKEGMNVFTLNQSIELDDYDTVYLIMNDGASHRVVEDIGKNGNCCYKEYVYCEKIYLYMPIDDHGNLIRNQIVYDPDGGPSLIDIDGKLEGTLVLQMYPTSQRTDSYIDIGIPLDQKKVITLKDELPLNKDIYICIKAKWGHQSNSGYYGIYEQLGYNNTLISTFNIQDNHEIYVFNPK